MPGIVEPQLATLVDRALVGDDWSYEIKFDGSRMLALETRYQSQLG
jgi:bifunctional non-homologous end joining protein LigD